MALVRFRDNLLEQMPDINQTEGVFKFLQEYIEKEQKEYKNNKKDNKLSFGKFSGYTIKEVASSEKGKSYLEWLMAQSWFTPDKFQEHYDELKRLKITKKVRQPLD